MTSNTLRKRKIAVLGSRSVGMVHFILDVMSLTRLLGKSSLVVQFIENHFVEPYFPTIENTFSKGVVYRGVEYDCDIIDTAGQVRHVILYTETQLIFTQDEYSILSSKHAIGIHGYVLVYSVASRRSFDMIQIVYDKIADFCGKNDIPCVIVGSKSDLQSRYV